MLKYIYEKVLKILNITQKTQSEREKLLQHKKLIEYRVGKKHLYFNKT